MGPLRMALIPKVRPQTLMDFCFDHRRKSEVVLIKVTAEEQNRMDFIVTYPFG